MTAKINGDKAEKLMNEYNVKHFPTIVFFKGDKHFTFNGPTTKKSVLNWVEKKAGDASR